MASNEPPFDCTCEYACAGRTDGTDCPAHGRRDEPPFIPPRPSLDDLLRGTEFEHWLTPPERADEPPFINDDARPCMATGCTWPGRFIVGIDGGTTTCWCVQHIVPQGTTWLLELVNGVRKTLEQPWQAPDA